MSGRIRLPTVLAVVGSVLLSLGLLAGAVNREVLDGARFADHVDAVRTDPAVARQVGEAITGRLLTADPDLVAVRPAGSASSPPRSGTVRRSCRPAAGSGSSTPGTASAPTAPA